MQPQKRELGIGAWDLLKYEEADHADVDEGEVVAGNRCLGLIEPIAMT
jgi:hypothetical protein